MPPGLVNSNYSLRKRHIKATICKVANSRIYTKTVDLLIFQTVAKWSQKSLSVHRFHGMEQACSWVNG